MPFPQTNAQANHTTQAPPRGGGFAHRYRLLADTSGGTVIEMSVAMTLLLMVIFGIMDCSRALYFDHYVCYSAEEAARYAMVRGSTWSGTTCTTTATESCAATSADVNNFVKSITPIGTLSKLTVNTTWTGKSPSGAACNSTKGANSPGCVVQVQVTYNFNFVLPFLPQNSLLLKSTSAVPIAQ